MKEYKKTSGTIERTLPFKLKFRVLFGNTPTFIGLFFMAFGGLFLAVFGQTVEWRSYDFDNSRVVQGVVMNVSSTNSSVNEETVLAFNYQYNYNGNQYTGTSYSETVFFEEGQPVDILVLPQSPEISRIKDMRRATFGFYVILFIALFPIIGFLLAFFSVKRAIIQLGILQRGKIAFGTLVNKVPTNTRINEQRVYELFFEFTADNGKKYTAIGKTHLTHNLEDEAEEKLVYDPANPENAVMIDELPKVVKQYFEKQ